MHNGRQTLIWLGIIVMCLLNRKAQELFIVPQIYSRYENNSVLRAKEIQKCMFKKWVEYVDATHWVERSPSNRQERYSPARHSLTIHWNSVQKCENEGSSQHLLTPKMVEVKTYTPAESRKEESRGLGEVLRVAKMLTGCDTSQQNEEKGSHET